MCSAIRATLGEGVFDGNRWLVPRVDLQYSEHRGGVLGGSSGGRSSPKSVLTPSKHRDNISTVGRRSIKIPARIRIGKRDRQLPSTTLACAIFPSYAERYLPESLTAGWGKL